MTCILNYANCLWWFAALKITKIVAALIDCLRLYTCKQYLQTVFDSIWLYLTLPVGAGHWLVAYRKAEEQKYRNVHRRLKEDKRGADTHQGNTLDGLFLVRRWNHLIWQKITGSDACWWWRFSIFSCSSSYIVSISRLSCARWTSVSRNLTQWESLVTVFVKIRLEVCG